MTLTIVVPCYNEAARLPVDRFRGFLEQHPDVTFIFVNDGSRDDTLAVLEKVAEGFAARVKILDRKQNRGKGESVREGMLQALQTEPRPDVTGFWDADLATPLEAIVDLAGILEREPGIEMVFGSRVNLLGRKIVRKATRHYLGRIFATVISILLRLPVYDTQCGAKLFRVTPELKTILEQGPFITRWVFDVELIARWMRLHQFDIAKAKDSVYEFPLYRWEDIAGSKVKPHDFLKAFLDVVRIYLTYLRR